jgi:hypothetical protein
LGTNTFAPVFQKVHLLGGFLFSSAYPVDGISARIKELKTAIAAGFGALESVLVIGYRLLLARDRPPLGRFGPSPSGWHKSTCAPRSARDCRRSGRSLPRARSACALRTGPRRTATAALNACSALHPFSNALKYLHFRSNGALFPLKTASTGSVGPRRRNPLEAPWSRSRPGSWE